MKELPEGVRRHPPVHLLDDRLTVEMLPRLILAEVERNYGNNPSVWVVKVSYTESGPNAISGEVGLLCMWGLTMDEARFPRNIWYRIIGDLDPDSVRLEVMKRARSR